MRSELVSVRTGHHPQIADITADCQAFLESGADGLLNVFVPHATAGVAILETGAGSDDDLLLALDWLLPREDRWQHRHGSAGHGRIMYCRRSSRHTRRCRWSAVVCSWERGSRSAWWTPTSTTLNAKCG